MPNTLIHLAVQGASSAAIFRTRRRGTSWPWDWPLIFLGAVLPDVPWILQRALRTMMLQAGFGSGQHGDPIFYDLRLFAGIQSSLLFCLLLAGACALATRRPMRCFAILAFGSALHLLLDATQTKWANGVLFLAPFDWRFVRFDWAWPEHPAIPALTALSLLTTLFLIWRSGVPDSPLLVAPTTHRARWLAAAGILALWGGLPWLLSASFESSGAYSIESLRLHRPGEGVELGNAWVFLASVRGQPALHVRTMSERQLPIAAAERLELEPGRWSLRGTLIETEGGPALSVHEAHRHRRRVRESFSLLGLALVGTVWLRAARQLL